MLHDIGVELANELRAKGCPFAVVDGPERNRTTTFARERIVLEYDDAGDAFGPKHSAKANPKNVMIRHFAVKLTIYAQSPSPHAFEYEHRYRAEHVLDLVLCALQKISVARRNFWSPKSGKFVDPPDLAASETPAGAVYEFTFTFERGVSERKWDGTAKREVIVGTDITIQNEFHVSVAPASETD